MAGLLFSDDWMVVAPDDWPEDVGIKGDGNWLSQSESLKFGLNRKFGVVVLVEEADGVLSNVRVLLLLSLLLLLLLMLLLLLLPLLPLFEPPLALPVGVDIVEPAPLRRQTSTKKLVKT